MKKIKFLLKATYPIWLSFILGVIVIVPFKGYDVDVYSLLGYLGYLTFLTSPFVISSLVIYFQYIQVDNQILGIEKSSNQIIIINVRGEGALPVQKTILVRRNPKMDVGFNMLPWSDCYHYKLLTPKGIYRITFLSSFVDGNELCDEIEWKKYPSTKEKKKRKRKIIVENNTQLIRRFEQKYADKTSDELEYILENARSYQKEAVMAAQNILKSRT